MLTALVCLSLPAGYSHSHVGSGTAGVGGASVGLLVAAGGWGAGTFQTSHGTESWQVVVLTQPYLCPCRSPELFMSGHVSKASDIYVSVLERLCVTWV